MKAEGENAIPEILPGTEIMVGANGTLVLRRDGRGDEEYNESGNTLYSSDLLEGLRSSREHEPFFEVRPFGPWLEPIDEIVATKARVSIRRNGRREYLTIVNGHGFRMTNDLSGRIDIDTQGNLTRPGNDEGPALNFICSDPDHEPDMEGKVETVTDPENPEVIVSLEAENASVNVEQMAHWCYWAGIQAGSHTFLSDESRGEQE